MNNREAIHFFLIQTIELLALQVPLQNVIFYFLHWSFKLHILLSEMRIWNSDMLQLTYFVHIGYLFLQVCGDIRVHMSTIKIYCSLLVQPTCQWRACAVGDHIYLSDGNWSARTSDPVRPYPKAYWTLQSILQTSQTCLCFTWVARRNALDEKTVSKFFGTIHNTLQKAQINK